MSNPTDWILQYQTQFPDNNNITHTHITPTTAADTTASRNSNLIPDAGRVSKPVRRRSRASRRTPTTLLNTDATNFRAMVQQFTGSPAAPFNPTPQIPNGSATLSYMDHIAAAGVDPARGFRVQYPNSQLQQQQQQHMFMIDSMHRGGLPPQGGPPPLPPPATSSASENINRSYDNYMLWSMGIRIIFSKDKQVWCSWLFSRV